MMGVKFMNWLKKVFNRRINDRADAILVMSIMFVPFFFLCAGFAMDLTKAVYVKQQYQIMGQEATTAATRQLNVNGSITEAAVSVVVKTYTERFNGARNDSLEATSGGRGLCPTVKTPEGIKQAPYMIITIDGGRNNDGVAPVIYKSANGAIPTNPSSGNYNPTEKYYSISAKVYDTAPNLIMGMFNRPCQMIESDASSIAFGSQEDIEDFNSPLEEQFSTTAPVPYNQDDGSTEKYYFCNWRSTNKITWTVNGGTSNATYYINGSNDRVYNSAAGASPITAPSNNINIKGFLAYFPDPDDNTKTAAISCENPNYGVAPPPPDCPSGLGYIINNPQVAPNNIEWNTVPNVSSYRLTGTRPGSTPVNIDVADPGTDTVKTNVASQNPPDEWTWTVISINAQGSSTGCGTYKLQKVSYYLHSKKNDVLNGSWVFCNLVKSTTNTTEVNTNPNPENTQTLSTCTLFNDAPDGSRTTDTVKFDHFEYR